MRQLAWLHARPRPPAGSKQAERFDPATAISRHDQMKAAGIVPPLPPNPAPHLTDWLIEAGLVGSNGHGAAPLSWGEIHAWQQSVHLRLAPWENRLLRRLSAAYVTESRAAEEETAPAPYHTGAITEAQIRRELAVLDAVLG